MNALVSFRANGTGNLSVRPEQRVDVKNAIRSNFETRMKGIEKALMKQAGVSDTKSADNIQKFAVNNTGAPPENELGRDAFLQLLVQQLSNQDPMEPMDNSQMIAQLAQFSSLEQMEQLNSTFGESFEFLNGNVDQLNFISAQGLLGKFVEGLDAEGDLHRGTVESVHLDGSIVVLTVDGKPMPMSAVIGIANEAPPESEASGT